MFTNFVNFLFGCTHKRTTFPISTQASRRKPAATYVACLDCGKELAYSWEEMRILPERYEVAPPPVGEQVRSFSATK